MKRIETYYLFGLSLLSGGLFFIMAFASGTHLNAYELLPGDHIPEISIIAIRFFWWPLIFMVVALVYFAMSIFKKDGVSRHVVPLLCMILLMSCMFVLVVYSLPFFGLGMEDM